MLYLTGGGRPRGNCRIVVALAVLAVFAGTALGQSIVLNGQSLQAQAVNRHGTVLVPMRAIFSALGAQVTWYPAEQKIEARRGHEFVELWVGTPVAHINRSPVQLNVPPLMARGTTYVPLRFVAEALGTDVQWDPATKLVRLETAAP